MLQLPGPEEAEGFPGENPDPAATILPPVPHLPLADGTHAGIRWFVERIRDLDHPWVTACGFDGDQFVFDQIEIEGASPAKVRAWIDHVLEERRARLARRTR